MMLYISCVFFQGRSESGKDEVKNHKLLFHPLSSFSLTTSSVHCVSLEASVTVDLWPSVVFADKTKEEAISDKHVDVCRTNWVLYGLPLLRPFPPAADWTIIYFPSSNSLSCLLLLHLLIPTIYEGGSSGNPPRSSYNWNLPNAWNHLEAW